MEQCSTTRRVELAVVVCMIGMFVSAAPAAQKLSGQQGDTYASIARLPDWSGVWVIPFEAFTRENLRNNAPGSSTGPPLTPEQAAIRAERQRQLLFGELAPLPTCGPPGGMPNVMRFAFGVEFLFTPGRVTMLLEQGPTIRRIHTDGRPHASDPDPTYAGDSIGHWEDDTLVVDTTAITPMAPLASGVFTSGNAHVTERIRRIDRTHLQIDTVVEDPIVLRSPWRYSRTYERSDGSWFERYCDNNRDGNDSEPDLTPPKQGAK
jgi:hypothetical protein